MKFIVLFVFASLWNCGYERSFIPNAQKCYREQSNCPSKFNCNCGSNTLLDSSNQCIIRRWVCDARKDCTNGEDEVDCLCASDKFQCNGCNRSKQCRTPYQCISKTKMCNGVEDCVSGLDEYADQCKNMSFQCHNGFYISLSLKCDGRKNCSDGSDEHNCSSCRPKFKRCDCGKMGSGGCGSGIVCYPDEWRCNGALNCPDNSDEKNCSCPTNSSIRCACNSVNNFTCSTGETNRICYAKNERCDGDLQCADGSDEWNCSVCPPNHPLSCNTTRWSPPIRKRCYNKSQHCDGKGDCDNFSDEWNCYTCPKDAQLNCACNQFDNFSCQLFSGNQKQTCYSSTERCNTLVNCPDISDESDCTCPNGTFTCTCFSKFKPTCNTTKGCISMQLVNDGKFDCKTKNDEEYILQWKDVYCGSCALAIIRLKSRSYCISPWCDNATCYDVSSLVCKHYECNLTDVICTSTACKGYHTTASCTKLLQCADQTVILGYNFCNGRPTCDDKSDELTDKPGFKCSSKVSPHKCVLPQWNLYDQNVQCYDNSDICFDDQENCYCFSCLDSKLIIATSQVCDGIIDCYDMSDECLCENIKAPSCLELLSNHYINGLPCYRRDATCSNHNGTGLLDTTNHKSTCNISEYTYNMTIIECLSDWGAIKATLCDQRPECIDFRDECESCSNPPAFCNDTCRHFYPMGDRYCDGYIDEAWIYINDSRCPRGFDERYCPMRFNCSLVGKKESIDFLQKCNGIKDCLDGRDEENCTKRFYCKTKIGRFISIPDYECFDGKQDCIDGSDEFQQTTFSTPKQLISNVSLNLWFWINAIITLIGNSYVFISTILCLKKKNLSDIAKCNHMLVLNLSISDFIMGIYLMIIVIKDVQFNGVYSLHDYEWRTSHLCALAGSLCVISSQTSLFIMVILTSFRLYTLLFPIKARNIAIYAWIIAAILAWLISLLLVVVSNTFDYFNLGVLFVNRFTNSDTVTREYVKSFACSLAILSNTSISEVGNTWASTKYFLNKRFPNYRVRSFGYYGATSMCMPSYYADRSNTFWMYSITVTAINFFAFSFIFFSYILIIKRTSNRSNLNNHAQTQIRKTQGRITRLIITDALCWIPICIMAFVSVNGVKLPPEAYVFTAGVLLPINSVLNPILYSPFCENLFRYLFNTLCCRRSGSNKNMIKIQTVSQLKIKNREPTPIQ